MARRLGAVILLLWIAGCDDHAPPPGGVTVAGTARAIPWLTDITDEAGLDFIHISGGRGDLHLPEIMGAGAALFDGDGDGDLDIYLTNGHRLLPDTTRAAAPVNRYYRQDPGGRFVDATAESGLGDGGYGMGVAAGDVDNDGDVDVYVANYGPDALYRNNGDGTFSEVPGAGADGWATSVTMLDYDRDGRLDIFVTRYLDYDPRRSCVDAAGRPGYCNPTSFPAATDLLLRNRGDGTFSDVSDQAGIAAAPGTGLGVVAEDFDGDGFVDVYVANDRRPNHLWMNRGDGRFQESAIVMGVAVNGHGLAEASMGVIADDLDGDGGPDLFMTHLKGESNTYYRHLAPASGFDDATSITGLDGPSRPYTGFGAAAIDLDLDGHLDLLVANGRVSRGPVLATGPVPWNLYAEPNQAFRNDGRGRFTPLGEEVAPFTAAVEISRALAVGDIDGDGDPDVLVANIEGRARLYRNNAPRSGHWITVRAVDSRLRRDAIGARVTVAAGGRLRSRTIRRGDSYLTSREPAAWFGLGDTGEIEHIEVLWPDGRRERFRGIAPDQVVTLERGAGS